MKGKSLLFILTIMCLSLCLMFAACGKNNNEIADGSNQVNSSNTDSTSSTTDGGNGNSGAANSSNTAGGGVTDPDENNTPAHTHTYGAWEITKEPTCTTDGEQVKSCSCGDTKTEAVLAKGHSYKNTKCSVCENVIPKSEGLEFTLNVDKKSYSVTGIGSCKSSEIVIPSEYEGLPVTGIADGAFENCTVIVVIIIPNSVTSIGNNAFKGCTRLNTVSIPESVKTIGNSSFENCTKLVVIIIAEGIESIGDNAFANCTSLLSFNIPSTLKNLGVNAFLNCVKAVINTVLEALPENWELGDVQVNTGHTHNYGEWTVITEPTCAADGSKEQYCSCGNKNIESIAALPHTEETVTGKAPTCTEAGLTDGKKCTVCGVTLLEQETIKAKGHTEETVTGKAPTCTETGLTDGKKCTVCGETILAQETIDAKGHTEETVTGKVPTCTETGLTDGKKCTVCGVTLLEQETIDATGHTEETVTGKAPTCTETGLTDGKKCTVCGETILAQETIDAKGHTEETVTGKAPTCTEAGLTDGKKCSVCGEITLEQETIDATGHTEETVTGKAPTCTETGLTDGKKCSVCGETTLEQEIIKATGHNVVVMPAKEPTFEEDGNTEWEMCSICEIVLKQPSVINRYVSVTVEYDKNALTVTAPEKASVGDTVTVSANVKSGYLFTGWYMDGQLVSTATSYKLTLGETSVTLTASAKKGDKWDGTIASSFAGGNGTSSSPYLISTGAQLARLASLVNDTTNGAYYDKCYKLTNDIDLANINWTPIGTMITSSGSAEVTRAFQGKFDGCGYTISNLNISSAKASNYGYLGLFGCAIDAEITDINLQNVGINVTNCTGGVNMGSVVGRADRTTVARCNVNCNVNYNRANSNDTFIGGIVGRSYSGTIVDCVVNGTVSGINSNHRCFVGGILAYAGGATVSRCISNTVCYSASGNTAFVAGLVSYMIDGTKVNNCLSLGSGEAYNYGGYSYYVGKLYAYSTGSSCSGCYESVTYTEAFFTSTLGWSTSTWDLTEVPSGKLPTLIQN